MGGKNTLLSKIEIKVKKGKTTASMQSSASNEVSPFTIHSDALIPDLPDGDLWVFGYGSLMWRPDFKFLEQSDATIYGYHRSLCVLSWVHRGTKEKPGLVLGLDSGGNCSGKAFKICASIKEEVAQYLYGRELATLAYLAKVVNIDIIKPGSNKTETVIALTFVANTEHAQYTSDKSIEQLAHIVSTTSGVSGHSKDYLFSTMSSLRDLGIEDTKLESIASLVQHNTAD